MQKFYDKIIEFVLDSGKRVKKKFGKLQDIGVTKQHVTEEDLRIEQDLKKLIIDFDPKHELYSEEKHQNILGAENIWVADPISGTRFLIEGDGGISIIVGHTIKLKPQFSVIYDVLNDELFTAYKQKGAFMNNKKIQVSDREKDLKILFKAWIPWQESGIAERVKRDLQAVGEVSEPRDSSGLNDCHVASGQYDAVVTLTKDAYASIPSSLIVEEAGGIFSNHKGQRLIQPADRIFIGANKHVYGRAAEIVKALEVIPEVAD